MSKKGEHRGPRKLVVSHCLPARQIAALRELSEEHEVSMSGLVCVAVTQYLKRLERLPKRLGIGFVRSRRVVKSPAVVAPSV